MEAVAGIAAFGLACNVMQTVHFSIGAVSLYKNLYKGLSPDPDFEYRCSALQKAAHDLRISIVTATTDAEQAEERELQRLAQDLVKIVAQLQKEMNKCKLEPRSPRIDAVGRSFKYIFSKKSKIDEMASSLREMQNAMEFRILIGLRKKVEVIQAQLEHDPTFNNQRLWNFLGQLQLGHTRLTELIDQESGQVRKTIIDEAERTKDRVDARAERIQDLISDESTRTRDHIDVSLGDLKAMQQTEIGTFSLLHSLEYIEMNARRNAPAIVDIHEGTYHWIYEETLQAKGKQKWFNFARWLRSEGKIYWISGKPGSGKSTLIRFLTADDRTMKNLQYWRRLDVKILSAFIWNAGTELQRSQKGLLATLLYQLLAASDQAAQRLEVSLQGREKTTISDWSKPELQHALFKTLSDEAQPIFIFIDGLDEIDRQDHEGPHGIWKIVYELATIPNVRLCVGSREEPLFVAKLKEYPGLRLQDLTEMDMRKYVEQTLADGYVGYPLSQVTTDQLEELTNMIVRKAEGVFLWVHYVTSNIRNGLISFDDYAELRERVDILPSKLSDLYREMWKRINKDDTQLYRSDSSTYFRMILRYPQLTFLQMLVFSRSVVTRALLSGGTQITDAYLVNQCERFCHQLVVRSAGLLEVSSMDGQNSRYLRMPGSVVSFIHRTARDFLVDTEDGQRILKSGEYSTEQLCCLALLAQLPYLLLITPRARAVQSVLDRIHILLYNVREIFDPSKISVPMLDLMASTINRDPDWPEQGLSVLKFAAWMGSIEYVSELIHNIPSESHALGLTFIERLLGWTCDSSFHSGIHGCLSLGDDLIAWLLSRGASPNHLPTNIDDTQPSYQELCQSAFVTYLTRLTPFINLISNKRSTVLRTICDFVDHGANITTRLIQNVASNSFSCFGECWRIDDATINVSGERKESRSCITQELVLVEMSIGHMFRSYTHHFENWLEEPDISPQHLDVLKQILNVRNAPPPKVILFVLGTQQGEQPGFEIASTAVDDRLSEQLLKGTLSYDEWLTHMRKGLIGNANPVMHSAETLQWLVERDYLPRESLFAESAENILLRHPHFPYSKHLDVASLGSVDWAVKPEYDHYLQAMKSAYPKR